jgi:DNA helicase-2/ATP-dependent DNA helicase PcrA
LYDAPEGRVANLRELRSLSLNYPDRRAFLDELAVGDDSLVGETDEAKAEFLTLSTIHSAKGCEWDRVIVINLIEGGLPGGPSEDDPLQIEEERRLLYVAMTRARRKLVLTYPVSRETVDRGARCFAPCRPSRFLSAEVQACLSLNQDEDDPGALLYEYEPEYGRRSAGDRDRGGWRRRYR